MFVFVVFGNLNMGCFVLSVICGVKRCVVCVDLCVLVCEWFLLFNVFAYVARDVLCDVVWFAFSARVVGVCVCVLC